MDTQLKQQWVDALESGKYKKGKHALRKVSDEGETWCCLGVLCDIFAPKEWGEPIEAYDHTSVVYPHIGGVVSVLPTRYYEMVGIHHESCLIGLNDNSDTFEPVIDYIRREL